VTLTLDFQLILRLMFYFTYLALAAAVEVGLGPIVAYILVDRLVYCIHETLCGKYRLFGTSL